jgi:transcriptional regulator with XRE-family HTH domain
MDSIIVPPIARRRRTSVRLAGDRETQAIAAALGREIGAWRRVHRVTLEQLAARIGIGRSRLAQLELGKGGSAPLRLWVATGIAIGRPVAAGFSREIDAGPEDGGHLAIQELVLRLARAGGRVRTFELQTRSLRSVDVGLRDDRQGVLILSEIWNTIPNVGAAKRDTDRKVEEVRQLAAAQPATYRVAWCWVVRATAANRALVARYPSVFEAAFPGSSRAWVRALTECAPPPDEPGLVWADVAGTRLFEWRRR